jgi:hypothetical protein
LCETLKLREMSTPDSASELVISLVKEKLETGFKLVCQGERAVEMHKATLGRCRSHLKTMVSNNTCLCCLRRRPQYQLPCGHILCDICVVLFGEDDPKDPYMHRIPSCFLCGEDTGKSITVKIHPPTAGVGVLCIDGGGTRGIVPLVLMKRIQDCIDLPIPLQRFVKVAFGVSIGTSHVLP